MTAAGVMIVGVTLVFWLMWKIRSDRREVRRLDERLKRLCSDRRGR